VAEWGDTAVEGGIGPVRGGKWVGRFIAVAVAVEVGATAKDV
jgi:hypothetical protein